jgi:hypothetical protein
MCGGEEGMSGALHGMVSEDGVGGSERGKPNLRRALCSSNQGRRKLGRRIALDSATAREARPWLTRFDALTGRDDAGLLVITLTVTRSS